MRISEQNVGILEYFVRRRGDCGEVLSVVSLRSLTAGAIPAVAGSSCGVKCQASVKKKVKKILFFLSVSASVPQKTQMATSNFCFALGVGDPENAGVT